jgi:hypothetical protein
VTKRPVALFVARGRRSDGKVLPGDTAGLFAGSAEIDVPGHMQHGLREFDGGSGRAIPGDQAFGRGFRSAPDTGRDDRQP